MGLRPISFEDLQFEDAKHPELAIRSWSDAARTVRIAGFTKQAPFVYSHTTNNDRSQALTYQRLPDLPIYFNAYISPAGVRRGQLYVEVSLSYARVEVLRLCAGYLTDMTYLNWPPGKYEHSVEGPGLLRFITGTNPAAGVEFSQSVPTNARWQLRSVHLKLVTDATVANRRVRLRIASAVETIHYITCQSQQTASLTYWYTFQTGYETMTAVISNNLSTKLPHPIDLLQDWTISTETVNLQAGDDYGIPYLTVMEWIEE